MKFEKLLEKYRQVCADRDELRALLANRDEELRNVCNGHAKYRDRVESAIRLLAPQPREEQVNQTSGGPMQADARMGSPKLESTQNSIESARRMRECPHCHSLIK